jgi:uncharacterized membrane protein
LTGGGEARIRPRKEIRGMRALPIAWGLASALALAGCGSSEPQAGNQAENAANNSVIELPRGPMLGPVDLSLPVEAGGEEPFWRMRVAPGRINHATAPGATPAEFYPIAPEVQGDRATWTTQTPEGEAVTLTLTLAACGEGRPLRAEARIGTRRLEGCAAQAR